MLSFYPPPSPDRSALESLTHILHDVTVLVLVVGTLVSVTEKEFPGFVAYLHRLASVDTDIMVVLDEHGSPVPHLDLRIQPEQGQPRTARTGSDGVAYVPHLGVGSHSLYLPLPNGEEPETFHLTGDERAVLVVHVRRQTESSPRTIAWSKH